MTHQSYTKSATPTLIQSDLPHLSLPPSPGRGMLATPDWPSSTSSSRSTSRPCCEPGARLGPNGTQKGSITSITDTWVSPRSLTPSCWKHHIYETVGPRMYGLHWDVKRPAASGFHTSDDYIGPGSISTGIHIRTSRSLFDDLRLAKTNWKHMSCISYHIMCYNI